MVEVRRSLNMRGSAYGPISVISIETNSLLYMTRTATADDTYGSNQPVHANASKGRHSQQGHTYLSRSPENLENVRSMSAISVPLPGPSSIKFTFLRQKFDLVFLLWSQLNSSAFSVVDDVPCLRALPLTYEPNAQQLTEHLSKLGRCNKVTSAPNNTTRRRRSFSGVSP